MSVPPGRLQRGLAVVAAANGIVATLLFVVLTLVVSLQVFTRFVLHLPFIWSEEAARFLFFWVALLGAAMSVKNRRHFVLDVTGKGRKAVGHVNVADLVPDACVLAFSLLLLVEGIGYAGVGMLRTASNSRLNMSAVYAAIPVFAGLSAVYAAGNLCADAAALFGGRGPSRSSSSPPPGAE